MVMQQTFSLNGMQEKNRKLIDAHLETMFKITPKPGEEGEAGGGNDTEGAAAPEAQ